MLNVKLMAGGDNMSNKRVQIRISETNYERLADLSKRYGISVNSIVSFLTGQWLDTNYDLKDSFQGQLMKFAEEKLSEIADATEKA